MTICHCHELDLLCPVPRGRPQPCQAASWQVHVIDDNIYASGTQLKSAAVAFVRARW